MAYRRQRQRQPDDFVPWEEPVQAQAPPPDDFVPWEPEPVAQAQPQAQPQTQQPPDDFVPWQPEQPPSRLPATEQDFQTQYGRPPATDEELIKYRHKGPEETFKPFGEPQPQAEGMLATGARAAAHTLGPMALATRGAYTGGAALAPLGPWGAAAGAIGGGLLGYFGGSIAQESALKAMGFDDSHQQAVNAKTNPKSALAGEIAGSLPFAGVGAASAGVRAIGAGVGATLEAGTQYLGDQEFDPTRIAGAAGAGALLTRPTALAETIGGRAAKTLAQQQWHGAAGPDAAAGTAKEQPPPRVAPDDMAQPPSGGPPPAGPRVTPYEPDPAIAAAIRGEPIQPRVTEVARTPEPRVTEVARTPEPQVTEVARTSEPRVTEVARTPEPRVTEVEPAPGYWGTKLEQEFPRVQPMVTDVAPVPTPRRVTDVTPVPTPRVTDVAPVPTPRVTDIAPVPTPRVTETVPSAAPHTPREAIAQRAPGETAGGVLRRLAADERGGGKLPPKPPAEELPPEVMPTPRTFEGEAAPGREGKFAAALEQRGFTPEQIRAMPPERVQEILQKRQGEVGAGPPTEMESQRAAQIQTEQGQPTLLGRRVYENPAEIERDVQTRKIRQNEESAGGCYKCAAKAAKQDDGSYVIGLVNTRSHEPIYHAVVKKEVDGKTYYHDPTLNNDGYFSETAFNRLTNGFRSVHEMTVDQVRDFGRQTKRYPDPHTLNLPAPLAVLRGAIIEPGKLRGQITGATIGGAGDEWTITHFEDGRLKRAGPFTSRADAETALREMTGQQPASEAPAVPPPAAAGAGAPPPTPPGPPPTVGQAAAAAGGTPPPPPTGPTSMVYAPPQQRSNLSNLVRSMKLMVGADIGPHGKAAVNVIRGGGGKAQQTFEQMVNLVAPHQATVHAMDPLERRAMINRMEGENRWPGYTPTPEQQQLIKDNKTAMDLWKDRLSSLDRTKQMDFVENYLSHMYENPQQAQKFFGDFIRRGGAGSTKKRTLPTYEDAIEAGLKPFSDNPIEIATRYGLSMKNFIAANDALERGVETGVIGYFKPGQTIGASGSPEPLQVGGPPPGWKKLDAPSKNKYGLDAYAPEDFADKYNTFYHQGIGQRGKPIYEALRNSNSAWTQLELGLNAYHFFTMANEAIISDVAKGIAQVMSGQFKEGAASIIKSPLAPRTRYVEGKRFQQEYLDPNSTNPIASIMAEANARPIGRGHAADILGGQAHPTDVTPAARGSFIKSLSRDKINFELEKAWSDIKQDWGLADTVGKQALYPFKQASRALQTVGAPLFDHYIPALKAGAVHSQMDAWIKANPNIDIHTPEGRQQAVAAAQKIVDSTDNRFGEMIHDNLFMNQVLRQAAMVSMRSFSWTVGAMREIAGGTVAAGKAAVGSIKNRENRFSMAHPEFDPRISYALAFPFVIATTSAIYQFLKTGEPPQDVYDLYAPRTGGTVPGLGGKGQVPEHVLMPGFQKDVYGWLAHPQREGYAKLSGLTTTAYEQLTNENWRGDPIYRRGADPMEHLQQRTAHILSRLGPIGVKNFVKGQPETSEIPAWQTALGFRAPGADIQDPEALENWMRAKSAREWEAKERHEKTERKKYSRERVVGPQQYERVSPGYAAGGPVKEKNQNPWVPPPAYGPWSDPNRSRSHVDERSNLFDPFPDRSTGYRYRTPVYDPNNAPPTNWRDLTEDKI